MRLRDAAARWGPVAAYALVIYSTLYPVRILSLFLRRHDMLRITILCLYVLVAALIVYLYFRTLKSPGLGSLLPLWLVFAITFYLFRNIAYLDKKVHLAEYGLMGFLCWRSFASSGKRGWRAYGAALLLTAAIGIVDELLELVTPMRHCSLGDMIMNAVAGVLGLLIVAVFTRGWEARSPFSRAALLLISAAVLYVALTQNHVEFFRTYLS